MVHLAPVRDKVTGKQAAQLFLDTCSAIMTDGQTERVNRVLDDTLRSIFSKAPQSWSDQLPTVEFALNNAVSLTLRRLTDASIVSRGEDWKAFSPQVSEIKPASLKIQLSSFLDDRLTLNSRAGDAMASANDKQKEYSHTRSRGKLNLFKEGDLVLLDIKNLPLKVVSSVESNKLKHRFIVCE
ncbi:Pol protein [Phytophthora palmivora]|uniref:Pol protein n=1 Tax=Phytophthora palmivora TaxID=4796 RepID=A0A2P4XH42_9STRA|nr:Pol protein [Phytophthora palmivora]